MIIGLSITSGVLLFSTLYLKYKGSQYKKELEYTNREQSAKLEYTKNQEATLMRDSNKKLIEKISPLLNGVSYIKDNNGDLVFYDKDYNQITESSNAVVNLINDEKHSDLSLYYYNSLYKVYEVGTDEGKVAYINKDDNKEVNSIPDDILVGFASKQKVTKPKLAVERADELELKFIESKNGLITKFKDWDFQTTEFTTEELGTVNKLSLTPSELSHLFIRAAGYTDSKPSEYAAFGTEVELEEIHLFISEEVMAKITDFYSTFRLVMNSNLKDDSGWLALPKSSSFGISYTENGVPFYYGHKSDKTENHKFNNFSLKFYYLSRHQDKDKAYLKVLSPKVSVKFNGDATELYIY